MRPTNFDAIARPYRWMEYLTFGRALERCRNHFLPRVANCRRALVIGDGDGRFLAALLAADPELHADALDGSQAMLRLLERRAQGAIADVSSRLRTHHSDALRFEPQGEYDLVVTHFFLDCLSQVQIESLVARIVPRLEPGALWLVSDFRIPPGPLQWLARAVIRMLYLGFRLLTGLRTKRLPAHAAALTDASFRLQARHLSLAGMLTTELWEYTPAMLPPQRPKFAHLPDPVPDPEPPSPSLPEPDPGVFHHEPAAPQPPPDRQSR